MLSPGLVDAEGGAFLMTEKGLPISPTKVQSAMISIRKYLDGPVDLVHSKGAGSDEGEFANAVLTVYRSALAEMGRCSVDACPAEGPDLIKRLAEITEAVTQNLSAELLAQTDAGVQQELRNWGRRAAQHYRRRASEVKDLLLVIARTIESVGLRDRRCAEQMNAVTRSLQRIASLDDIAEIRSTVERSAVEIKDSIDRMTSEGKAVLEHLRAEVSSFEAKLEAAEELAARDALTHLRSRLSIENHLEEKIVGGAEFCVALLDLNGFKSINDAHGHLVGDEVLKQFAHELRSACRSTDVVGRWGGDEFLLVLHCVLNEAQERIERVRKWVCGQYAVKGAAGELKLQVDVAIGLVEYAPPEALKALLQRADGAMYKDKSASREGQVARPR